jgi:hypothetical protein
MLRSASIRGHRVTASNSGAPEYPQKRHRSCSSGGACFVRFKESKCVLHLSHSLMVPFSAQIESRIRYNP